MLSRCHTGAPAFALGHASLGSMQCSSRSRWRATTTSSAVTKSDAKSSVILKAQLACAGGLIFGWNALAIMLKAQGNYNGNCPPDLNARCAWQESHLAVLWTIGVFASELSGLSSWGPVLDYVGPKLTAMLGKAWDSTQTLTLSALCTF